MGIDGDLEGAMLHFNDENWDQEFDFVRDILEVSFKIIILVSYFGL